MHLSVLASAVRLMQFSNFRKRRTGSKEWCSAGILDARCHSAQCTQSTRRSGWIPLHAGGTRFIGAYLARQLIEDGNDVTLLTRGKAPITSQIPDDTDASYAEYKKAVSIIASAANAVVCGMMSTGPVTAPYDHDSDCEQVSQRNSSAVTCVANAGEACEGGQEGHRCCQGGSCWQKPRR